MSDIYSKRLAGPITVQTAQAVIGTVPAGRIWVVKTVMIGNGSASTTSRVLVGLWSLGTVANRIISLETAPLSWRLENMHLAFGPGEQLACMATTGGGSAVITVSGFEFS